uniref:NADH-ubiquinone oxidoreductase chain 4L n=1 Tax=Stomatella planulata TaxID=529752 RepID=A0A1I9SSW7_9VEST|nr:NADH dehydrogenase subunit 4L [Stomatella planulata]AOZ71837.1 NADH dehydrogenase subunit 4L [Stomatella planulata]
MVKVSLLCFVSCFGVLFSIMSLSLQKTHLLSALLSLEAMTLNLFILLLSVCSGVGMEGEMCLVLITMGACEASLGLAVLVSLIRAHGNDYVSSFSCHKC